MIGKKKKKRNAYEFQAQPHGAHACAVFVFVTLLACWQLYNVTALSKYGSTGEEVTSIQTKLQELGYYKGNIDGIYGSGTKNAVIQFQKAKGLDADGIAGSKTLAALGIKSSGGTSGKYTDSEISLLARIISAEARASPMKGRSPSARSSSTGLRTRRFLIRFPALFISRAHFPA